MKSILSRAGVIVGLIFMLSGCASFDDTMGDIDSAIMKGDFRGFSKAKTVTLAQICKDFESNEVAAKKKWGREQLGIPAVIVAVSKSESSISSEFAVNFRDLNDSKITAVAYTRNDLKSNEDKVMALQKGSKIKVVAVLNTDVSSYGYGTCSFRFDRVKFEPLATKAPASVKPAKPLKKTN